MSKGKVVGLGAFRARVRQAIAGASSVDDAAFKVCLLLDNAALFPDDPAVRLALLEATPARVRAARHRAIDVPNFDASGDGVA